MSNMTSHYNSNFTLDNFLAFPNTLYYKQHILREKGVDGYILITIPHVFQEELDANELETNSTTPSVG